MVNPNYPDTHIQLRYAQASANSLRQKLVIVKYATDGGVLTAFTTLVQQGARSRLPPIPFQCPGGTTGLASRHAVPTIHHVREYVVAGGLMSYGTSITDAHRQAGVYAGQISPKDLCGQV